VTARAEGQGGARHVLGISAFYHDSAACLVRDGRLVAASQEERFSRVRFDASFPLRAIQSCLEIAGIQANQLDAVAFYEKPLLRFDRAIAQFVHVWPRGRRSFVDTASSWMSERLRLDGILRQELGYRGPIYFGAHHESHAASAFYPSPFEEAAIITVDGVGEWTTNTIGHGRDQTFSLLEEVRFPHSLGLLYAAVTEYLGFEILSDEYKVMGLAPFGEPRLAAAIRDQLIDLRDDGSYRLDLSYFRYVEGEHSVDVRRFEQLFGGPVRRSDEPLGERHADVAASLQLVLEEALLAQARHAHARTGSKNLVMAGGVALNCVANGRILREGPFEQIWIQPAAGDSGGAVGAALLATHRVLGGHRAVAADDGMQGALLGPSYERAEADKAVAEAGLVSTPFADDLLDQEVARRLSRGEVVGWFQGRMEFGPRALGSRSILADPRPAAAQQRVNERIKFREGFRPFGPAVLAERTRDWFELDAESPYMLLVAPVAAARRLPPDPAAGERRGLGRLGAPVSTIPAVTHVDGSARIQTADERRNPRFFRLLTAFERETGCPVVLNTSFNLRGEPIVCTPADAIRTFLASEMEALVLGSLLVDRPAGPPRPLPPPPARPLTRAETSRFGRDFSLVFLLLTAFLAYRRSEFALPAGVVAALFVLVTALFPASFAPFVRAWRPLGQKVSRALGAVLLGGVHLLVVGFVALLRGRKKPPWPVISRGRAEGYWEPWEAPRGGPDRMY